jgi:DNA-binding transcriptional LysR family regulator
MLRLMRWLWRRGPSIKIANIFHSAYQILMSDDWEQHRTFLSVLREGSLSGAARALALAQPTVRRRIAALEQEAGVALFARAPDGLVPTAAALALRPHAEAMEIAARAFQRDAARGDGVTGEVRVSASEVIAIEVLPPILAQLRVDQPGITVSLSPSNRNEDLLRREADVAVRMVPPEQGALVAQYVGNAELGIHAHQRLLADRALPDSIAAVRAIGLVGTESDNAVLRAMRARGLTIDAGDFAFRSDSDLAHLAAIRAGLGAGFMQLALARRDPALVRLLPDVTHALDTWVAMHEDLRHSAPVRAVFDALVAGMKRYLA